HRRLVSLQCPAALRSNVPESEACLYTCHLMPVNGYAQLRQQFTSIPFDDQAAEEYGKLRARLTSQGELIGPNDLMSAAIALPSGLTLVTHNTAEFRRVPGLNLEDWQ